MSCLSVCWSKNCENCDESKRDCLHRETMDFLSLSTALHSCHNLSEKVHRTFFQCQEVLLSSKDKLSRVVANYPVLEV